MSAEAWAAELTTKLRVLCPSLEDPRVAEIEEGKFGFSWRSGGTWVLGEVEIEALADGGEGTGGKIELYARCDQRMRADLAYWRPGEEIPSEIAWVLGADR